jgi:hypothetical protein
MDRQSVCAVAASENMQSKKSKIILIFKTPLGVGA